MGKALFPACYVVQQQKSPFSDTLHSSFKEEKMLMYRLFILILQYNTRKIYSALTEASKGNMIHPLFSQRGIMGEVQFYDRHPCQFSDTCHRVKKPESIENL